MYIYRIIQNAFAFVMLNVRPKGCQYNKLCKKYKTDETKWFCSLVYAVLIFSLRYHTKNILFTFNISKFSEKHQLCGIRK